MYRLVLLVVVFCLLISSNLSAAADPWADTVIGYDYDGDGNPADDGTTYNDPSVALGEPARMTGIGTAWPSVVSIFSGPWQDSQVVSVAAGGYLTVGFDEPVIDDPAHPYGVDLIVFGNAAFVDSDWPNGRIGQPASLWAEPGLIELSCDGVEWFLVPDVFADSLFPTQGYLDSGPYDSAAGSMPADFLKPVDPALSLSAFDGLTYAEALALYDGSGGGAPIDIAATGLSEVRYVRISVPDGAEHTVEIDALAAVPEPASLLLLICAAAPAALRRRS